MIKRYIAIIISMAIMMTCLSGCTQQQTPSPENPITLTMWHVYGSQTKSPLNTIIDEFNGTTGKENGITINVVSVTSSSAIDKALAASANGEPGAESLPDLFTAYPRVVEIVGQENLLVWNEYFTENELAGFHDEFLAEGYFDSNLLMLPVAKSTEALFINQTLFDRFQSETGVSTQNLTTFDGLFEAARKYYDWSDGQNFVQLNDYYNYAYIGMKAHGKELISNSRLQLQDEAFKQIWMPLAQTAIYGGICLDDGYAAAKWKTVEIIANTGSTADVLYQPEEVIYADNTTEPITTMALPYPKFTNNSAGVVHRGGGLFAMKSDNESKNQAAYIFAKWLTESGHNLDFVTQAGYLPITDEAFDSLFTDISIVENENYHSVYEAVDTMSREYSFYALPLYNGASETQNAFENNVKSVLRSAHTQYLRRVSDGEDPDTVMNELTESSLAELISLSAK
ncbi:MAG: carbohydrate ABC transporter substrate-binding protein [Lachnospiraceae bacterium]|nr:carbohydrate ABC transporter substrate-binding protein [Lachnospiraceae bacterium]